MARSSVVPALLSPPPPSSRLLLWRRAVRSVDFPLRHPPTLRFPGLYSCERPSWLWPHHAHVRFQPAGCHFVLKNTLYLPGVLRRHYKRRNLPIVPSRQSPWHHLHSLEFLQCSKERKRRRTPPAGPAPRQSSTPPFPRGCSGKPRYGLKPVALSLYL